VPHRVIQWATGNVGRASARSLISNPRYELVGAFVYDPEKHGRDVGEICGTAPVGVVATSDVEEILAMEADCVSFCAAGDTRDIDESLEYICRLLASGKNVVSTSVSRHMVADTMPDGHRESIEDACRKSEVSFHSSGVNPGFTFDVLPINLSVVCDRIDHIHCVELVDMVGYSSRQIAHETIGMGLPPEQQTLLDVEIPYALDSYYVCARLFEDAFGCAFDEVRITREKAVTEARVVCAWGTAEPGTVAARRIRYEGMIAGKPRATWDIIWRISNEVAPEWPSGEASWEVIVSGDPDLRCRIDVKSKLGRSISLVTAMHAVNAIPAVIAAPPGIKTRLDLAPFAGGHFS
jgi:hypothetical protein